MDLKEWLLSIQVDEIHIFMHSVPIVVVLVIAVSHVDMIARK